MSPAPRPSAEPSDAPEAPEASDHESPPEDLDDAEGLAGFVRTHPWVTAIMLVCTVGGAFAGPFLFDETWPLARQIAAGAFGGAWVGLITTVTKMIG